MKSKNIIKDAMLVSSGFLIGVFTGVLFAPKDGKSLRKNLKDKILMKDDIADEIQEQIDVIKKELNKLNFEKDIKKAKKKSKDILANIDELLDKYNNNDLIMNFRSTSSILLDNIINSLEK